MRLVGRKDRLIDLKMFLAACSCDFCGCCLRVHISFSLCYALQYCIDGVYVVVQ